MIASALVLAAIAAEPSVPVPLGVAAPSAGVLYVVDADQGVTAVELRSGKTLWKAAGPRIPLLVVPSGVATLVTSGVEVLDLRSGKRVLASESVGLPPSTHVIGNYVGHVGQGLEAKARSVDDRLELDWEIVVTHVYGMRPAEVTRTTGGAQVSMRTGKVTRRGFAPAPAPKVPAAVEQLYSRDGHTNIRTPVAGPSWAYVRMEPGEGARRAVLHRWDLGGARELAPLVLPSAPRGTGEAITQGTLDGRHLLVSWQRADASDPAIPWDVYALPEGNRVGSVEGPQFGDRVSVLPPMVVYQRGVEGTATLVAVQLDGKKLWERPMYAVPMYPPVP
jgi:hypothetical protein